MTTDTPTPFSFTLPLEDVDLTRLPEGCRQPGTEAFTRALTLSSVEEFAPIGGSLSVDVEANVVRVSWSPVGTFQDPTQYATRLLKEGLMEQGVALLENVVHDAPDNRTALLNLGMALSDLRSLEDAQRYLHQLLTLDPEQTQVLIALGVAQQRAGDLVGARAMLARAVEQQPRNAYARLNFGAVLGTLGESEAALVQLREALRLHPGDQAAMYAVARYLLDLGGTERDAEADGLLRQAIEKDPSSPIAEEARRARTDLATRTLRKTGGTERMDVVMYCLSAIKRFETLPRDEVQRVTFEVALLGQRGLDINNPERTYTLRSLPDTFSGLQLAAMLYVGLQILNPGMNVGLDFDREYEAARLLHADGPRT